MAHPVRGFTGSVAGRHLGSAPPKVWKSGGTHRAGTHRSVTLLALLTVGTPALGTSPSTYVAGQKMTFSGSLGGHGRKRIHLPFNMNRPGDRWTNVAGFSTRTDAAGRFRFTYPSPAMWGISRRSVRGRRRHNPEPVGPPGPAATRQPGPHCHPATAGGRPPVADRRERPHRPRRAGPGGTGPRAATGSAGSRPSRRTSTCSPRGPRRRDAPRRRNVTSPPGR